MPFNLPLASHEYCFDVEFLFNSVSDENYSGMQHNKS